MHTVEDLAEVEEEATAEGVEVEEEVTAVVSVEDSGCHDRIVVASTEDGKIHHVRYDQLLQNDFNLIFFCYSSMIYERLASKCR